MAFGVKPSSTYGPGLPDADRLDYDDALRQRFERLKAQGRLAEGAYFELYAAEIARKYHSESEALADFERPDRFRLRDKSPEIYDLSLLGNFWIVSARLRDLILEFEPDLHQFWPVRLEELPAWYPDRKAAPHHHVFGFKVGQWLSSLDVEASDPGIVQVKAGGYVRLIGTSQDMRRVRLRASLASGRHLWGEHSPNVGPYKLFLSKSFFEAAAAKRLQLGDVAEFGEA